MLIWLIKDKKVSWNNGFAEWNKYLFHLLLFPSCHEVPLSYTTLLYTLTKGINFQSFQV